MVLIGDHATSANDDKLDIAHSETALGNSSDLEIQDKDTYTSPQMDDLVRAGQGITGYEHFTHWQTLKALTTPTLYAFLMTFSSVCDGYQVAMGGSIVANAGFVQKFGTGVNAAGHTFIESNTLSNWGLAFSISQTIGLFCIGP